MKPIALFKSDAIKPCFMEGAVHVLTLIAVIRIILWRYIARIMGEKRHYNYSLYYVDAIVILSQINCISWAIAHEQYRSNEWPAVGFVHGHFPDAYLSLISVTH